ncbi:signal peptidase II [Donghicola tyrosinivorans]|jgi:signal peptidase II|uniref:Lipoprotein signal peptidase n=1 Tax=Donghicola tyrosinivorans TaxID=1652492 RepID=A0A2T0WYP5_9RHOB|nr:signal peptidase II [Donghicola tyrosinivorans]PRY91818.1 signal peptidase II [Donghicola tyrosinivorans]
MSRTAVHIFWPAFWVFLADQASKYVVVHLMGLMTKLQIDVLPPLLQFRMAWNRGVNFGLFPAEADAGRWFLIAIALVISLGVIFWMVRSRASRMACISAGLLVGGALGNVVDRVLYGAVADFLNMSCCGINNPFSFNIADIAVFAGAIGLVLFDPKSAEKKGA